MRRYELCLGVFLRRGKPAGGTMMESMRTVIVQPVLGTGVGVGHFPPWSIHPRQRNPWFFHVNIVIYLPYLFLVFSP